jgi:hypothetical protein
MDINEISGKIIPTTSNTVHVSIPAEVAFDLDRFHSVQKDILGRLGCSACCSGWDIRFEIQRRFVVDADLNVRDQLSAG